MTLPAIDWSGFLEAAPYFNSALLDTVSASEAADLPPLPRAAWYWDIFNAEVSNGGISQYLYNQALSLPGFERVPEFIAAHPQLHEAMPFVRAAHEAWAQVAPEFARARESDDWPEDLFQRHEARFEALQTAFFKVNHLIACRVHGAIAQSPHEYFHIEPIAGLAAKGVVHVSVRDGQHRLRFKDGFPVGPNLLEQAKGECDVVWFSDDRGTVECERGGYGGRNRQFLHFASLSSVTAGFERGRLRALRTEQALWIGHGLSERFSHAGTLENFDLHLRGEELLNEFFDADGGLKLRIEFTEQGERRLRYWPSGALNVESLEDLDSGIVRYLQCLDPDGGDRAPGGDGELFELIEHSAHRRLWLQGPLVGGVLHGDLLRLETDLKTGRQRELSRTSYQNGREADEA